MDIFQVKFQNNAKLRYFEMQSPDMKKKEIFDQTYSFYQDLPGVEPGVLWVALLCKGQLTRLYHAIGMSVLSEIS